MRDWGSRSQGPGVSRQLNFIWTMNCLLDSDRTPALPRLKKGGLWIGRYIDSQRETPLVPIEPSLHGDDSVFVCNSGLAQGETVTREEPQQVVWRKWLFTPCLP